MLKNFVVCGIMLLALTMAGLVYAEIDFSQVDGGLGVYGRAGSTTLNDTNTTATVTDVTGGIANITYDVATNSIDVDATSGNVSLTYNVAKIFLNQNESINIQKIENFNNFIITNVAGEIDITFPDGSRVVLGDKAAISMVMMADNNFSLTVVSGSVTYVDQFGNISILTPNSAAVLVQGFGTIPGWRTDASLRNPATP